MRKTAIAIALAVVAVVANGDRYTPGKGSFVRIEGTSTMHDWKMEGSTINGELNAPAIEALKSGAAVVKVAIPVTSIHAEHSKMDSIMATALKAGANPEIRYEMTTVTLDKAAGDTFEVKTHGKLTIAGATRDLDMTVTGVRNPGGYVITGQAPIRMSDYGITPPTAMFNTIKTGNDVKVTFRWVVQATAQQAAR